MWDVGCGFVACIVEIIAAAGWMCGRVPGARSGMAAGAVSETVFLYSRLP